MADTVQLSTQSVEVVASGNPTIQVSTQSIEAVGSGGNPLVRLSTQYIEVIAGPAPRFVDLAGNLGGASSYGRFHYGLAKYSRVGAFAPVFGADLAVAPPTAIEIGGSMSPQVAFGGSLGFDVSLTALGGSFGFTIAYGPSEMISGPLWAADEPCPSPPWGPSEPCPVPPWMAAPPCDTIAWSKSRLCSG